jgi:hypothetical protein
VYARKEEAVEKEEHKEERDSISEHSFRRRRRVLFLSLSLLLL